MDNNEEAEALALVLMGVSGAGKTTVGRLLAADLGWAFLDADDFHPESNRRKMAAGQALDDTAGVARQPIRCPGGAGRRHLGGRCQ